MEKKKYIHYGHKEFRLDLFTPPANNTYFTKPRGGLWASSVDAEFGWRDWCELENFHCYRLNESFSFTLRDGAKVLCLDSVDCLEGLPRLKTFYNTWVTLDFEKLMETYDAIELVLSADMRLYWKLYGWDCDSILILNPYVVEVFR